MSKPEGGDDNKTPGPRGSRAPLVITVVALAVVGSAYYAYYLKQVEYYTGRNLRLLAMQTAQVEGRVEMFEGFVRDAHAARIKDAGKGQTSSSAADKYSAPGIRFEDNCIKEGSNGRREPGEVWRTIEETAQGWRLALQTESAIPPSSKGGAGNVLRTCATVPLETVLRPIITPRVGAAFDVLLIATSDGKVLYSIRPPPSSSTLLGREEEWIDDEEDKKEDAAVKATNDNDPQSKTPHPTTGTSGSSKTTSQTPATSSTKNAGAIADRESGSTLLITNLGALLKQKGWRQYEDLKPATLGVATDHINVELGGADYVLFAQPYAFARPAPNLRGQQDQQNQWIVCGLVSASRFRYDVSAISTSIVMIAVAIALLALCCWPFLRVALIHPEQALTITDVVLLVICTIVGTAVITLVLLDAIAYRGISQTADDQLERFSQSVNDDFSQNVARAADVLSSVEAATAPRAQELASQGATKTESLLDLVTKKILTKENVGEYPYIYSIDWIDEAGQQQVRFARDSHQPVDVSTRQYFKLASLERTSTVERPSIERGRPTRRSYVLEWVRSKATGEVRAVLAKKTSDSAKWDALRDAGQQGPSPRLPFAVVSLTTELIDISHAIQPPGVEMAIIDESGEVVYHSDAQRIGYENFFAEADRNRDLRSAVVARRAGLINASYWGEDESMYVRPLTGSRWTLVTFRPKRLTRVLNVEGALLTLMLLLFSGVPYFVLYIVVLLVAPGYRAPRLWPDEPRRGDYLRLNIILVALLGLFWLNNYALAPWSAFYGILIIPALAIATTYLILHRRAGAPNRFAIGTALWLVVTAVLICHMSLAEPDCEIFVFISNRIVIRSILVIATLTVAALTALMASSWKGSGWIAEALARFRKRTARNLGKSQARIAAAFRKLRVKLRWRIHWTAPQPTGSVPASEATPRIPSYATRYLLCGVLLLTIGVAMPVVGFFAISRHVQSQLMVKYGQLRAAAGLEHRIDHVETVNVLDENSSYVYADLFSNRLGILFGSRWELDPELERGPFWLHRTVDPQECPDNPSEKNSTVPSWAASALPALYEDSIAIRPLFESGSADDLWHWCVNEPLIKLVRKIHFDRDVAERLWPPMGDLETADEKIVIVSHLPKESLGKSPTKYLRDGLDDQADGAVWFHLLTIAFIALSLFVIFWCAADFIARRVLLIDVGEPDWMAQRPLGPSLGDHIFLVRRQRDANELTRKSAFFDVSFETLHGHNTWSDVLETLDGSDAGRNVRILDFEYGINDNTCTKAGTINEKKLRWLERLLALADRTVVIVSSVGMAFVMNTAAPPTLAGEAVADYFKRWRALLDKFVCVTVEELDVRNEEWKRRKDFRTTSRFYAAGPGTLLEKETAYNSFLLRLRHELNDEAKLRRQRNEPNPEADKNRILDEIGERAETYYAGLWASCRDDEQLLLYQLARNGLANGKNRRTLRRLMARGLVRRDPNLELFSESFRRYVLEAAQRENVVTRAREKSGASTWDSLRVPFFVIIIAFILLLFATQKDMLTTTTALATALTTGLPVLMKLIGVFTERRTEAKE